MDCRTPAALLAEACAAVDRASAGAELIRAGENTLWRLPGKVVVRVGREGQVPAAHKELAVARWLRRHGVPAVRPLDRPPEPVEVHGRPVTFWHELPPHRPGRPVELAAALRTLHRLPPPIHPLDRLDPFVRLPARIDGAATLDRPQRRWLHARLAELRTAWHELALPQRPLRVVHGDAWSGNLAVADDAAYLLDFERTALGPPEWDLVTTAVGHYSFGALPARAYAEFCTAYGADVTEWPGYPVLAAVRELRLTCYALQQADADLRHRAQAHYRLACLRGEHGPRPWGWTALD
ncbi:aminoglycoside phosphotransferase family protein [Streptomyces sp. TLI_171]|uniref:aminoglycoside phosphotransferase family protein n=1 Tax=Streptomyces sp. TLI_171 TaxID=1938859 RepID=UPI000C18B93B|nr:aminoglycoside phosphotransferase family protein [Streptomyces sp. TLI_171]RKE20508.1 phosphotransferase family enzyme [Streptomyces sp. TLI_171]